MSAREMITRRIFDLAQTGKIARVGQFVQIHDLRIGLADQIADQRRTDESRPAGDNDFQDLATPLFFIP